MKYTVRTAQSDGCARLAVLVREPGYSASEELLQRKLAEFASLPGNQVLVADYNGEVVGLLCFSEIGYKQDSQRFIKPRSAPSPS